jgi:hypothetical protein
MTAEYDPLKSVWVVWFCPEGFNSAKPEAQGFFFDVEEGERYISECNRKCGHPVDTDEWWDEEQFEVTSAVYLLKELRCLE